MTYTQLAQTLGKIHLQQYNNISNVKKKEPKEIIRFVFRKSRHINFNSDQKINFNCAAFHFVRLYFPCILD
jgi:hypothetical protein